MLVVVAHIKAPATTQTLWNVKAASSQPPWEAPRCQLKVYFPSTLFYFFFPTCISRFSLSAFFFSFTKAIFLLLRPRFVSRLLRFQNKPEKIWVITFVRKHTFSAWQIKRQEDCKSPLFSVSSSWSIFASKNIEELCCQTAWREAGNKLHCAA